MTLNSREVCTVSYEALSVDGRFYLLENVAREEDEVLRVTSCDINMMQSHEGVSFFTTCL